MINLYFLLGSITFNLFPGDGKQKREGSCVGTKGFRAPEVRTCNHFCFSDYIIVIIFYVMFIRILTHTIDQNGVMIGAITSGHIADFIGWKGIRWRILFEIVHIWAFFLHKPSLTTCFLYGWNQAMGMSSMICIARWLTVYLSFVGYLQFSIIILIYLYMLFFMFYHLDVSM